MEVPKKIKPREINSQKREIFIPYRSNSQRHYKNITSFNYDHRIRLNPLGEKKTLDIRDQIPLSHIQDTFIKSEVCSPKNKYTKTAYEKDKIEDSEEEKEKSETNKKALKKDKKPLNNEEEDYLGEFENVNFDIKSESEPESDRKKNKKE